MRIKFKTIGIIILIYCFFMYGFLIGEFNIFPYTLIKNLLNAQKNTTQPQRLSEEYYGRWGTIRKEQPSQNDKKAQAVKQIESLPYLKGYKSKRDGKIKGITLYDSSETYKGVTLFCSGHKPVVYLMDLEGTILHQWSTTFKTVWPEPLPFPVYEEHKQFIRRARVYPNGDLLCVFEYIGLVKLDKNSNVIWKYTGLNHHDIDISEDNFIYSLGHSFKDLRNQYPDIPYQGRDDFIIILDQDGKQVKKISIFEAFYHSEYSNYLKYIYIPNFFHTNTVHVIKESVARKYDMFNEGDVLVSLRNIHSIAVIDIRSKKVKWALNGMWHAQHQSEFLDNGHIILFDNKGGNKETYFKYNKSRILEFDPLSQEIFWEYPGDREKTFFSHWLGYNQRLPNGNTLITESTQGRIFEVTQDNKIVWEYYNPHRTGNDHKLIASVMGARRIDEKKLLFLNN